MNDEGIILVLKNHFDKRYFRTTGSAERIQPNGLYFIKNMNYLYEYIVHNTSDILKNIHVIIPKKLFSYVNKDKYKHITFYCVDDVAYVFGTIHNYIHNNHGFYVESRVHSTARVHSTVSMNTEGIRLFHTPEKIKKQLKHISNVVVGAGTTIGPYTVIHKGVFRPTYIGENVTIGSLVNIGHNCYIDDENVITPGCVFAGRVMTGLDCWFGINTSVKHGVKICDNVVIGQHSNVRHDITESGIYAGEPLRRIGPYTENWNF